MARHRKPVRSTSLRGRLALAALAAGAAAVAGQALGATSNTSGSASHDIALAAGSGPPPALAAPDAQTPNVLPNVKAADSAAVAQIAKSEQLTADRAARAAAARRPLYVLPAVGTFTSGFGSRWGTEHLGDDIANAIGTPIGSVTDGTVLDAGPASGFGQWVRVQNDDGTISVYGHVNEFFVKAGQHVLAGQEIATIGNRGESTGPHLHFEVWVNGNKVDPQPWLAFHGLDLGPMAG